ncbi:MAG: hypothetical protein ACK4UN_11720, partial [Limisphaerales bacterium]
PSVQVVQKPAEKPAIDLNASAYSAALKFVEERFPGPKRFSEMYQSSIERKGDLFVVTLSADDLGGTTPVRYFFSVEMESSSSGWTLKNIHR